MKTNYKHISTDVKEISIMLQNKIFKLQQILSTFDDMFNSNNSLCNSLAMLIYAGEQILEEKKISTNCQSEYITYFERRLYTLKITRVMAVQRSHQIKLMTINCNKVLNNIKNATLKLIPDWKTQIESILGLHDTLKKNINLEMIYSLSEEMKNELTIYADSTYDCVSSYKNSSKIYNEIEMNLQKAFNELVE